MVAARLSVRSAGSNGQRLQGDSTVTRCARAPASNRDREFLHGPAGLLRVRFPIGTRLERHWAERAPFAQRDARGTPAGFERYAVWRGRGATPSSDRYMCSGPTAALQPSACPGPVSRRRRERLRQDYSAPWNEHARSPGNRERQAFSEVHRREPHEHRAALEGGEPWEGVHKALQPCERVQHRPPSIPLRVATDTAVTR